MIGENFRGSYRKDFIERFVLGGWGVDGRGGRRFSKYLGDISFDKYYMLSIFGDAYFEKSLLLRYLRIVSLLEFYVFISKV